MKPEQLALATHVDQMARRQNERRVGWPPPCWKQWRSPLRRWAALSRLLRAVPDRSGKVKLNDVSYAASWPRSRWSMVRKWSDAGQEAGHVPCGSRTTKLRFITTSSLFLP